MIQIFVFGLDRILWCFKIKTNSSIYFPVNRYLTSSGVLTEMKLWRGTNVSLSSLAPPWWIVHLQQEIGGVWVDRAFKQHARVDPQTHVQQVCFVTFLWSFKFVYLCFCWGPCLKRSSPLSSADCCWVHSKFFWRFWSWRFREITAIMATNMLNKFKVCMRFK